MKYHWPQRKHNGASEDGKNAVQPCTIELMTAQEFQHAHPAVFRRSFSVKTDVESGQEAFTVAPGDTVSLLQVVLKNGMRWILCRNADGAEGWFADPDSAVWEESSDGMHWGYFDEAHFAG